MYLLMKALHDASKAAAKKAALFELIYLSGLLRKAYLSDDDECCKAFDHPHWRT
jgi:hypothetical protein